MRIHDPLRDPPETRHGRKERRRQRLRDLKKVPVLPTLITLGNLYFGFLAMAKVADAVMLSARGQDHPVFSVDVMAMLEVASILVFVAMLFDALDGTVARLTRQETPFGAQIDSLADVVTFGVAPAYLAKVLIEFHQRPPINLLPWHPKIYYIVAAVYVCCAALRLARYNVETDVDHREFKGLPSPAAAAIICSWIAFRCAPAESADISKWLLPRGMKDLLVGALPVTLALTGVLMVSRLPYPHLVRTLVRKRQSHHFLLSIVFVIGVAAIEWQLALLLFASGYALLGPLVGLWRLVTTGTMERPKPPGEGEKKPGDAHGTAHLN